MMRSLATFTTLYGFLSASRKEIIIYGWRIRPICRMGDKEQLDWFLIDQYEMHDSFPQICS